MKKNKWEQDGYQEIAESEICDPMVKVRFKNGDIVVANLYDIIGKHIVHTSHEKGVVSILSHKVVHRATWDKIRKIDDPEFRLFINSSVEEQSKLIGMKIKTIRESRGIQQDELANLSDVSHQTISRIENGHNDINFKTLVKILVALNCTLQDLI